MRRTRQTQSILRGLYYAIATLICFGVWSAAATFASTAVPIITLGSLIVTGTPVPSITPMGYVPARDQFTPIDTKAVFQQFETGWMLWREDDRYFYVLQSTGWVQSYPADELAATLGTPEPLSVPADRVQTDSVFDALWQAERWGIAPLIGWATGAAVAYHATVAWQDEFGFEITLPAGDKVALGFGGRWHLGGVSGGSWTVTGAQPTFVAASFPTFVPTPQPTPLVTQAIYQEFEHGFMLSRVDSTCVWAYSYADQPEGRIVIPQEISAKPFGNYTYCLDFSTLPDVLIVEATPVGLQAPVGGLGTLWHYYQDVRSALGYATAPQQTYLAAIPFFACSDEFSCSYMPPLLTLPDGRVLSCGMRSASAGMCTVK